MVDDEDLPGGIFLQRMDRFHCRAKFVWCEAFGEVRRNRGKDIPALEGVRNLWEEVFLILYGVDCCRLHKGQETIVGRKKGGSPHVRAENSTRSAYSRVYDNDEDGILREVGIMIPKVKRSSTDILRLNSVSEINDLCFGVKGKNDSLHYPHIGVLGPKICQENNRAQLSSPVFPLSWVYLLFLFSFFA